MKDNQTLADNNTPDFLEAILNIAKEATQVRHEPASNLCINQSRTFNSVKVDIHINNQARPGMLRRLFAKIF